MSLGFSLINQDGALVADDTFATYVLTGQFSLGEQVSKDAYRVEIPGVPPRIYGVSAPIGESFTGVNILESGGFAVGATSPASTKLYELTPSSITATPADTNGLVVYDQYSNVTFHSGNPYKDVVSVHQVSLPAYSSSVQITHPFVENPAFFLSISSIVAWEDRGEPNIGYFSVPGLRRLNSTTVEVFNTFEFSTGPNYGNGFVPASLSIMVVNLG